MTSGWLYRQEPIWIVLVLMVAMTLTAEVAFRIGRHWHATTDDLRRGHFGSIMGSLLGLLALLLSFTFAMSANRYDARRQLVLADANVLSSLYLQSDLLPDPPRRQFKQLLAEYVDSVARVAQIHRENSKEELQSDVQDETVHDRMWKLMRGPADAPPRVVEAIQGNLIEALSVHRSRLFALESRVPETIIWLLLLGCLAGMSAIGLAGGLGNHRGVPARVIVTILLCATITVVIDLDRPREGLLAVSQAPVLELKEKMARDAETRP